MSNEIVVPSVGESITSGVIASWLKQNGDQIQEGDALFELETDKATLEIPSTASGTLEILVEAGAEVEIGQTVARLTAADVGAQPSEPAPQKPSAAGKKPPPPAKKKPPKVKPAPPPPPAKPAKPPAAPARPAAAKGRRTERVPMSVIRKRTAERLVQARQNAAYLTTFNEIDLQKVVDIRTHYKDQFEKEHGIKIGFMSFFVKACCRALIDFPDVNAQIDGNDIVYNYFYDIGVAISTDHGLIVPIIRDADSKHFAQIEATIADLAQRARDKKILPDELTGGTFTITNGGVFGSLLSTPIPAYPQTAILGMHAIKKRPVVIDDQITVRPMMYVALSYDHRVIDGREAIGFLNRIKEFIEDPDKLLLEL